MTEFGCFVDKVGVYKDEPPYDYCHMQAEHVTENCIFAQELRAQGKTSPTDCQYWRPVENNEQPLLTTKDAQRLKLLNTIAHYAEHLVREYRCEVEGGQTSFNCCTLKKSLDALAELNKEPTS